MASILVAEDDPTMARPLEVALAPLGLVRVVHDGLAALRAVAEVRPHLVVTDVSMPGMGGGELCRRLRADPETRSIRVALVSGTVHPEDADCGAEAFLSKPFTVPELVDAVRGLLAKGRGREEP